MTNSVVTSIVIALFLVGIAGMGLGFILGKFYESMLGTKDDTHADT